MARSLHEKAYLFSNVAAYTLLGEAAMLSKRWCRTQPMMCALVLAFCAAFGYVTGRYLLRALKQVYRMTTPEIVIGLTAFNMVVFAAVLLNMSLQAD